MRFVKGHGTENDFVILPDPEGALELTPALVAALCDRRAGIGADGVLRVVRAKVSGDAAGEAQSGAAEWFMDYRNADGSLAEMCGNGIRVYARYLVEAGLAEPGEWQIATRAGLKTVTLGAEGEVRVDMGTAEILGSGAAVVGGQTYAGLRVSMGNPHLACMVTGGTLAALDLTTAPDVDAAVFPHGVNVEFIQPMGERHVRMRVHERGSGETRSCGTGAVAAAAAAAIDIPGATQVPEGEWTVDVPGGTVTVTFDSTTNYLRGPATLVAEGTLLP